MNQETYQNITLDLINAIGDLLDRPKSLPALILFYSSIDIISSLTRPIGADDTNGAIFKDWVKKYMVDGRSVKYTEEDIWGARCGLLHTMSTESKKSRSGDAREIMYSGRSDLVSTMQTAVDPQFSKYVFVHLHDLVTIFFDGVIKFSNDVGSISDLQNRVFHHSAKLAVEKEIQHTA